MCERSANVLLCERDFCDLMLSFRMWASAVCVCVCVCPQDGSKINRIFVSYKCWSLL